LHWNVVIPPRRPGLAKIGQIAAKPFLIWIADKADSNLSLRTPGNSTPSFDVRTDAQYELIWHRARNFRFPVSHQSTKHDHQFKHHVGRTGVSREPSTRSRPLMASSVKSCHSPDLVGLKGYGRERSFVDASYSREAETRADGFTVKGIRGSAGRPRPMGEFLVRVTGGGRFTTAVDSHPLSADRLDCMKK
jgi:hypothetical protein